MGDTDNLVENKKTLNVIEVSMIVDCSKGTYIRTLCHDIGSKLSCGAAMNTLLRTRVGIFKHSEALTLSQIEELVKEDKLEDNIVSIEKMFCEYKKAYVLEEFANILRSYSIRGIVSGRWGGEEFIMISPYDIKYEQFLTILERLRVKVSKTKFQVDIDKEINITISIGVSKIDTYDILEDGVKKADSNLYKAKNSGRNKIVS